MNNHQTKREKLLKEMDGIERMHLGHLSEEYREREVDGGIRRTGPYYKHQHWKGGKNVSRRVNAEEAERLRTGIEGMNRFNELSREFVEATVAMTEEAEEDEDSKKNSG